VTTRGWSVLLSDCAVEYCLPGDVPAGLQVWCNMRATQTGAAEPLAEPLHATISAACNLKPNAVLRHEAWQTAHETQLKATKTSCAGRLPRLRLFLTKYVAVLAWR
jgi:hypothetical protein